MHRKLIAGKTEQTNDFKSVFEEFPYNVLLVNSKPLMNENAIIFHIRELNGEKTNSAIKGINTFQTQEVDNVALLPYETKFLKVKC